MNLNVKAVFLHVLADALGSVIVIISALLNKFQKEIGISQKIVSVVDPILW
jgi:Co/Zn/Cd efflux system component